MAASRNPLVRLGHIRDEIAELQKALEGEDYASFSKNYVLRRTAEHAILIISEAVKAISSELTDSYTGIDWRALRNIGNVLRHEYFDVDDRIVWRVVTQRLPELGRVVERMIADTSKARE